MHFRKSHHRHFHPRDPSLRPRYSARSSTVLRSPRTPAAHRTTSPLAYTAGRTPLRAAQTGLSCSAHLLVHVLLPVPRRCERRHPNTAPPVLPSSTHRHRRHPPVLPAHEGAVAEVRPATALGREFLPLSAGVGRGGLRCPEQNGGGLRTGEPSHRRARSGVAYPAPTRAELHRVDGSRISVARDAGRADRQRHPLRHAHGRRRRRQLARGARVLGLRSAAWPDRSCGDQCHRQALDRHHVVRRRVRQRPSTPVCRSRVACRLATGPARSGVTMESSASPTTHADDRLDHCLNHDRRAARRKAQPRPVAQIDDHTPMTIRTAASTASHLYQNEACHVASRAGSCTAGVQRANGRARADTLHRRVADPER